MSMLESPAPAPASAPAAENAEPSFESRLNNKLGGDGGAPLAGDVASHASQTYGP
jgi:hypothetical protein